MLNQEKQQKITLSQREPLTVFKHSYSPAISTWVKIKHKLPNADEWMNEEALRKRDT